MSKAGNIQDRARQAEREFDTTGRPAAVFSVLRRGELKNPFLQEEEVLGSLTRRLGRIYAF